MRHASTSPPRRSLTVAVAIAVGIAALVGTARPARADLYGDYVRRLEAQIRAAADYGITQEELRQIELAVNARPEGWTQEAEAFYGALERVALLFMDWGYTAEEVSALRAFLRAAPPPASLQPNLARAYTTFVQTFTRLARRFADFGFTGQELEVLGLIARAAPPVEHPQVVYQQTYAAWSREVADLERAFNDWGLTGEESRVLQTLRSLQPRLAQGGPVYVPPPSVPQPPPPPPPQPQPWPPQPPMPQPWPPAQPGWPGAPRVLNVCNQQIQVVMERMYYGFPRMSPTYVALLAGPARDLVEIDVASCQQRWLADGVIDFAVQPQFRSTTFVKHGGRVFYTRGTGEVFQVADDYARVADDGRGNLLRLMDRSGRAHTLQFAPSGQTVGAYLDGAMLVAKLRYRALWRPLGEL
jgi:hypothetical protein